MEMVVVESSNLEAVGYDSDANELYVEFKNGSTYKYLDVPFENFQGLMDAESHGSYLNSVIKKGGFEYVKLS